MKMSLMLSIMSMTSMTTSLNLMFKSTMIYIKIPLMTTFHTSLNINLLMDWMSLMFLSTVMFITSMILLFSKEYIPKSEHNNFFILLMMFVTSMILLILSNNLIIMLLGWDGLGLSSYILVIYYQNPSSSASGLLTILSNRLGDIMILMSIASLMMLSNWDMYMSMEFPKIIMMLLMIAAMTKSAQFPFSAWLPAAMAAPTPISALVHSSTLVTAGTYLMIRIMDSMHPSTMLIMMLTSSITAIYSSLNANWEQDMKKIIALSTLSQIAIMMFAISLNMINMAFFHLITHAMFKSTMFLCAGMMIHKSSYQDMRHMFTQSNSPLMLSTLGLSTMALMGIPFMSGFFSKDMIMENMLMSKTNSIMMMIMISSIGMTSTYTLRMITKSINQEMKSTDTLSSPLIKMKLSFMFMSTSSILMGAMLTWVIPMTPSIILPMNMKMIILLSLIFGIMLSITMNFNSKSFMKMGHPSISMWFINNISMLLSKYPQPLMKTFFSNDNSWKEMYGPQNTYNNLIKLSKTPDIMNSTLMFISMMMILPTIMLMY